jgi:endogenous inhibitor of DNA gyrase (YacG/DUF329 family)
MSRPRRKDGAGRCPICGRPRVEEFKPFCSKHCADVDLARWLEGRYVIPGKQTEDDETESPVKGTDGEE